MKAHRNGKERLEERVARLEAEVEQLKAAVKPGTGLGWESMVGGHQGSEAFEVSVGTQNQPAIGTFRPPLG